MDIDSGEVERNLSSIGRRTPEAADTLLGRVALAVEANARERAPVDTGGLRAAMGSVWHGGGNKPPGSHTGTGRDGRTRTTDIPPFPERPPTGEAVIFNTAAHAADVHEDMDARHDEGEAKYLERALHSVGRLEILETIAGELMREVRP